MSDVDIEAAVRRAVFIAGLPNEAPGTMPRGTTHLLARAVLAMHERIAELERALRTAIDVLEMERCLATADDCRRLLDKAGKP